MQAVKREFGQYFGHWNIELPEEDLANRSPGFITKAGWSIRYIFGKDGDREYLEFYAMHLMTDDRHVRIYEDVEYQELDAICSMFGFDPKIPGDEERAERENREYNQRVYKELQEKGLDMMSVNTYLSLNNMPK
ncbi:conserved hypothetical protein [Methanocella paludicola SANAE]|uniref:Uncharacterized protein n=1 Tax=Methanocella paludicola (strain DSM 17711 / JCM 13418 / NBRC 101707 / SANAE) TaxID=304371 RepID=D1YX54_METPS|nr:hypothetical protein [Methanocella paludicola]BAI61026.1 conserved hypothetical protein [Methanocella paludicola SANAE]